MTHPTPRRGSWTLWTSVTEGLRNIRDGATLGAGLVLITAAVVGATTMADITTVSAVVADEAAYLDAGGDILVVVPAEGHLSASVCDRLPQLTGVRAAAAVTQLPAGVQLTGRPGSSQAIVVATSGVADLLGTPMPGADQAIAPKTIMERWLWDTRTLLQFDADDAAQQGVDLPAGPISIAATHDFRQLSEAASTSILLITTTNTPASECTVRIAPQYREDLRSALPAMLGETVTNPVQVADRIATGALSQDFSITFEQRGTRHAGLLAGAFSGFVFAIVLWTRRGRSALYASLGVPYTGGVVIRWTETLLPLWVGASWGTLLAVTASIARKTPVDIALEVGLRQGTCAALAASALVLLAALWRPQTLQALKDR